MREPATREKRGQAAVQLSAETVTSEGMLTGFAYDPSATIPLVIQIMAGGAVIAEARAHHFRADLLAAGLSHGHHGFAARLRSPLKPGPAKLTLACGALRKPCSLTIPRQTKRPPTLVETLLAPPHGWTVADFLSQPACLPWTKYANDLGTNRFVDAAYQFALLRWPSDPEAAVNVRALTRGHVSPQGFIVQLLQSRERGDMEEALMSPFDAEFGF